MTIVTILAALVLAGCSHRPLYGRSEGNASVSTELAAVSIADQKTRAGQLIRNDLISSFGGAGGQSRYLLKLDVIEKKLAVSSLRGQKTDRFRYRLSVNYQLVDLKSGSEITAGASFSNVSYDTLEEPIADLRAAENARERAARELAQDLRLRISAFLATTTG